MRKVLLASKTYLLSISRDMMMVMCILVPLIMGLAFHFGLPLLEQVICHLFMRESIIQPYYGIFDLLLATMTPTMFCFSGVLVILEEEDKNISKYYYVTPVGRRGYLQSRLLLPAIVAFFYDLILMALFTLTTINLVESLFYALTGFFMALICAMLVVTFAGNKMEGMALIKLTTVTMFGIPAAYFIKGPLQYLFSFLPSYWVGKMSMTHHLSLMVPNLGISLIFIGLLYRQFMKKMKA